jgi:tetraacyldisaccharide 4'-kinase
LTILPDNAPDTSHQSSSQRFFLNLWYRAPGNRHPLSYALLPVTCLFMLTASIRRWWLIRQSIPLPVPVVVIGNISVGGTGKTPIVIALAQALTKKGIAVGIISRGFGSRASSYPYSITSSTSVEKSGDEALLIAQATQCPVVIDRNRVAAVHHLLACHPSIQLVLSDDGLQHYRLPRSMELIVIDGKRGMGNDWCLPSGPLREPIQRLKSVAWVFSNGKLDNIKLKKRLDSIQASKTHFNSETINLMPYRWRNVVSGELRALSPLPWQDLIDNDRDGKKGEGKGDAKINELLAVAAIGNPQRFFNTLESLGLSANTGEQIKTMAFDDHHEFTEADFMLGSKPIVLMTSKDAVKCRQFAKPNWWALEVETELPSAFIDEVMALV